MVLLITRETVMVEVTRDTVQRIARDLKIPASMVSITWENGVKPRVNIEMPPLPPPSSIDPLDRASMEQWEEEVRAMPGVPEFIKAQGIDNPEPIIKHNIISMMEEIRIRLEAVTT